MATAGGDTLGYWLTGKESSDSTPASMVAMASTHAKMGRLIKNLDMIRLFPLIARQACWESVALRPLFALAPLRLPRWRPLARLPEPAAPWRPGEPSGVPPR